MNNKDKNIDVVVEEKNDVLLSGKVSPTMLAFVKNMEGTFAEKIRDLIDAYSVGLEEKSRLKIDRIQTLKQNLDVMENTLKTIEMECNLFADQQVERIDEKLSEVIKMAMEQDSVRAELEERNKEFEKLSTEKEKLEKELEKGILNIEKLNVELNILKDTKLDLTNMNIELSAKNTELTSVQNNLLKDVEILKDKHKEEIDKLKEQLQNTKDELKGSIAEAKANKELLESKLDNSIELNKDLKIQVKDIRDEKIVLDNRNKELEKELKGISIKLQELEKINSKLDAQNENKSIEINALKENLDTKENSVNSLINEKLILGKDNSKLVADVENANKNIEKINEENINLKENIKNRELENNKAAGIVIALEKDIESVKKENKEKDVTIELLHKKIKELEIKLKK